MMDGVVERWMNDKKVKLIKGNELGLNVMIKVQEQQIMIRQVLGFLL